MRLLDFIRSMAPSFKRNDVTERLRLLRDDLATQTMPPFVTAAEDLQGAPLQSKVAQDYAKEFSRYVDVKFRGNWIEVTKQVLDALQANLNFIEGLVEENYGDVIVAAGLTYKKAQILQYIALADFVVHYSRRQLLYVLAAEANIKAKTLSEGKERPVPEIKWLLDNREGYFRALNVVALDAQANAGMFEQIPDVTITDENTETMGAVLGRHKLDPMNFGIIPIGVNPFHYFGIKWANWQIAKHQRAKEEKRSLDFRLEQLRSQRRGIEDPKLEKSIAYYENEVNALAAKIAKMEE